MEGHPLGDAGVERLAAAMDRLRMRGKDGMGVGVALGSVTAADLTQHHGAAHLVLSEVVCGRERGVVEELEQQVG